MERTFGDRFLDKVCGWDWALSFVFAVNVVLLVLLGMTYYVSSPEGQSRTISVIALVFILGTLVVIGPLLRRCKTREDVDSNETED